MDRQKGKPSEPTGPLPEPVDAAAGDGVIVPHVPVEGGEDCVPVEPACKKARRGRPPKGEKSDFNLLNFLESDRSGQYKNRHEESVFHRQAVARQQGVEDLEGLPLCNGLDLESEEGSCTSFGNPDMLSLVRLWLGTGCIAVEGSALSSIFVKNAAPPSTGIIIQDESCATGGQSHVLRGGTCCRQCLSAANRKKCIDLVKEWAFRVSFADLTHTCLLPDRTEQLCQASWMKSAFPEVADQPLENISYHEACSRTRNLFMHIPVSKQNAALVSFIGRSLKFLTPSMIAGLSDEMKKKVVTYVDALASGKLQPYESSAMELIGSGSLKSSDLARTLVPMLLRKADKMRRGCTERLGGGLDANADLSTGVVELGFLLGGCIKSPEIQKAFGIARNTAKEIECPLINSFLPRFFLADGEVLVESVSRALNFIESDGMHRDYMVCRDEVVYSRTYNMVYGLSPDNPRQSHIVGGSYPEHSFVESQHGRPPMEHLAQVHCCTLLKRLDTCSGGFMVQHLPRRKLITAASEAQDIAIFLDACCQANSDNPPLVVATDCHFSFDLFHRILVGLVKKTEFQDLPFLRFVRPGSAYFHALAFGQWTASAAFDFEELFLNTMTAYYIMLICCMLAHEKRGSRDMWLQWLPQCTARNMLRMIGQLATRLKTWPSRAVMEPSKTTEDSIELERDLNAKQKRRMLQKVTRNRDKLEKKLGRPLQLIKK
ncbi:unnamed protein product [Durusdinium trenchii]